MDTVVNLALGVLCMWLGGALLYVAVHGIDSAARGFWPVWQQILADVSGNSAGAGG